MATIQRFEDLECWRQARVLAQIVYRVTKNQGFDQDRDLRCQLRAAAVSAMSNLAEAHGRYSFEDKRRILDIALGSSKEVQSCFYVALDQEYTTQVEFSAASEQAETVARLISGSLANLDRQIMARRPQHGRTRAGSK